MITFTKQKEKLKKKIMDTVFSRNVLQNVHQRFFKSSCKTHLLKRKFASFLKFIFCVTKLKEIKFVLFITISEKIFNLPITVKHRLNTALVTVISRFTKYLIVLLTGLHFWQTFFKAVLNRNKYIKYETYFYFLCNEILLKNLTLQK